MYLARRRKIQQEFFTISKVHIFLVSSCCPLQSRVFNRIYLQIFDHYFYYYYQSLHSKRLKVMAELQLIDRFSGCEMVNLLEINVLEISCDHVLFSF